MNGQNENGTAVRRIGLGSAGIGLAYVFWKQLSNIGRDAWTWIGFHPYISSVAAAAIIVNNAIRYRYLGRRSDMPAYLLWIVAVTDPLAFNFWALLGTFGLVTGTGVGRPQSTERPSLRRPEES